MTSSRAIAPAIGPRVHRGLFFRLAAFALGGVLLLTAGCGGSDSAASATGDAGVASAAATALEAAYDGRFTAPPTAHNRAAKDKFVVVTSAGQASPAVKGVVDPTIEAAKAMGWKVKLCDANLDPAKFAPCFRDAIAQGADGIIDTSMDCPLIKEALKQTVAAGIPVVAQYAWDCNVTNPGTRPLFSAQISFGDRYDGIAGANTAWGADAGTWAVAQTGGKGTILNFVNKEYQGLKLYQDGFAKSVKHLCPDCKIKDIPYLVSDFGPQLTSKTQSALLQNPDTTVIQAGTNPEAGFSAGVVQAGKLGKLKVIGGTGLSNNFDLIRSKKGLDAVGAWPNAWMGYAGVDTLNQIFNGVKNPTVDQGIGWIVADRDHNMAQPGKNATIKDDFFKAAYLKRWGL